MYTLFPHINITYIVYPSYLNSSNFLSGALLQSLKHKKANSVYTHNYIY